MKFTYEIDGKPEEFTKDVEQASIEEVVGASKKLFDIFVELSPVDTGSFRSSWNATAGEPVEIFNKHKNWRNPLPPPKWPDPKPKFGESIHITNGAPYAEMLENGWSEQAPYGIVQIGMEMVGD